ncbi:carboxylesterase family protein [Propionispira raffinosivorans]|uniref:carboxylesterase family protein n=1 Tax=Propionispira raffinosivorans TaxID=86959 RepID=UPI00037126BA|nr:prolyl oligopeptidase family serine peptidase [Propionispira raffinosivorans]
MKKIICMIIVLIVMPSYYFIQKDLNHNEQKEPQSEPTSTFTETLAPSDTFVEIGDSFVYKDQSIQYMLIFPAKYTKTENEWPLIFFLHGSSLRGENLDLVKEYGPTWIAEQRPNFPFVVLAPQCPEGDDWVNKSDILIALLDDVLKKYRIDQNRVYLTGVSLGGRGAWTLASHYPEYFAALAPLAAASQSLPACWNKQLLTIPVWAFHGEKDPIVPLKNDEALIDSLRNQGGTPRFTILPGQGHNIAWVYKNKELYDWFLSNTRHP